jgi:hypothetical protein
MDLGWILTFAAGEAAAPQISIATEGGSGTPVPDLSIEVDNLDEACSRCGIVDRIRSHKRAVGRPALLCSRPFWAPAQHPCSRTIVGPERRLLTRFRHSHWPTWKSAGNAKQLKGCPQVSVRRIFCYRRGELVFFLAWHERSFSFFGFSAMTPEFCFIVASYISPCF